jgi:hypothetical protein
VELDPGARQRAQSVADLGRDRPGRGRRFRRGELDRDPVGAVVVGRDHDPASDRDRVAVEVVAAGVGEHDPRPVVVGEDERLLDRAGGDDRLAGADSPPALPEPGPRGVGRRTLAGARRLFERGKDAVIPGADDRGATHDPDVRQRCKLSGERVDPEARRDAGDGSLRQSRAPPSSRSALARSRAPLRAAMSG